MLQHPADSPATVAPFAHKFSTQSTGGFAFPCGNPSQIDNRRKALLLKFTRQLSLLQPTSAKLSHGTSMALPKTQPWDGSFHVP